MFYAFERSSFLPCLQFTGRQTDNDDDLEIA
jgi:hypothetical protein